MRISNVYFSRYSQIAISKVVKHLLEVFSGTELRGEMTFAFIINTDVVNWLDVRMLEECALGAGSFLWPLHCRDFSDRPERLYDGTFIVNGVNLFHAAGGEKVMTSIACIIF